MIFGVCSLHYALRRFLRSYFDEVVRKARVVLDGVDHHPITVGGLGMPETGVMFFVDRVMDECSCHGNDSTAETPRRGGKSKKVKVKAGSRSSAPPSLFACSPFYFCLFTFFLPFYFYLFTLPIR